MSFNTFEFQLLGQLLLATLLGGLIGLEREWKGKSSGLRTFAFVAMGSCLFTILSINAFGNNVDPSRVAANILTGIGFLGGGVIFRDKTRVKGITTAAGLWVAAAIGMGVGCGLYILAAFATFLSLLSLILLDKVDLWVHNKSHTNKE